VARDRGVRLLHSYLFAANAWGRIAARLAGIPAVASERTDRPRRRRREILAERVLAPLTAAYIVNSEAVARRVLQAVPAMRGRLRRIPNGIDLTPFAGDRHRCRADLRVLLRLPADATLAGVLGTLSPDKAHGILLDALSGLPPTVGLVVMGEGPERRALEDRIRAGGLSERVHLLGHRDDVPGLLLGLDLLVQSSLREGMPNAVLEGMAAGLPVVATAVGGTAEALGGGDCGVLVEPGSAAALAEAMAALLADPGRAAALAARARERVEIEYSLAGMIRRTEALYAEILQA
jgi:glycosyltransferase involved in cell wall biosynthesis